MMNASDNSYADKIEKLARDILILSRNTLLVNMRFLDIALSRFELIPVNQSTIMTDGHLFLYNPKHILNAYKQEREIPVRDYLHIVMHCVFRHMYADPSLNRVYWDLACDIAVENVISELGLKATAAGREKIQEQYIGTLKQKLKNITAEKIYHHLRVTVPDEAKAAELRKLYYADDHTIWYMSDEAIANEFGLKGNDSAQSNSARGGKPDNSGESSDNSNSDSGNMLTRAEAEADWKEIGEKMQMDLETFSKLQGTKSGSLMQELKEVNREKYDYTEFLKKFAVMGEEMKINDDEFDYIFYTYGLKTYGKMPLIEPLEYKDVKRIKEFVVAIDTSGSTSGELVQKFIQKTYNILKSTESFFSKINLHIIQCDTEIQEHIKITTQDEFDEYIKTMKIRGLGGTDFRPVFQMTDKLIENNEFTNLKGLIYFTDGFGTFPAGKPNYETAFVFVDDEYNNPHVPAWAIKLILKKDEI